MNKRFFLALAMAGLLGLAFATPSQAGFVLRPYWQLQRDGRHGH